MAGLRLGMAFASSEIIEIYNKIKPPYNINIETQRLVIEALQKYFMQKNRRVQEIVDAKETLKNKLEKIALVEKVFPSDSNFLLVKVNDANKIYDYLIKKQIIVRNRHKTLFCENCLRITVGRNSENQMLLMALQSYES